ncbi:hypothetical protein T03_10238 [Trichinella britovi]|uniref:Uncharacterized protein n=1 Tax=Trichinella britovi TaxID=45882 RepID=A0A0V1DD56_TRIBR|nr:hypothetical protein T03_10238 [Trichinella britovi]
MVHITVILEEEAFEENGSLYSKNMECRFLPGSWCSALSPTDNVGIIRKCDTNYLKLGWDCFEN